MISIRELRHIQKRQNRARKRIIKTMIRRQKERLERQEKRKQEIKNRNRRSPSKSLKILQKRKAVNHYQKKVLKKVIDKNNMMVSNLIYQVVEEKKYNPGTTPVSVINHPPYYQQPIIPLDPRETVRQIYLRDRLHYLQENYHLH